MIKYAINKIKKSLLLWLVVTAIIVGLVRCLPEEISVSNNVGGRELPIYCVETQEKKVALSFDAAWGNGDTGKILEILAKHNVKATFFMTGGWVNNYPDDVKKIQQAGHELGNHSENHLNMSELSKEEQKEEIMAVHKRVKEITGVEMTVFRPPYGDYDDSVVLTALACDYYPIQWSVDSLDWKDYGVASIIDTVCKHKNLKNGAIILMHNGATYTAEALDELLTNLKDQGYEIVPVSHLILKDNYHMDTTGMQIAD